MSGGPGTEATGGDGGATDPGASVGTPDEVGTAARERRDGHPPRPPLAGDARVAPPEHDPVARICGLHPALAWLWRWRVPLVVAGATLLGLALAVRSRPAVLVDDAAITMRYATRIAGGDGWTYNPGDRTNGASAPLYTMILALFDWVGVNVVTSARLVGTAAMGATFGLTAWLGTRLVGTAAGLLATGFLASWVEFHTHALTGMESALAAALGLAVIAALREDREVLAGVLLGLAVVNKLDAGLLALAVAVAYVAVLRRPPWRLAGVAAAVTAPWFAFSTAYFGSPLPHSFTQKQSGAVQSTDVPATWILENLRDAQFLPVALLGVAALALVPWVARRSRRAAAALAAVVTWAVLHGLAFSLIDLGDRFPWYLVVLYPALAVGAGCLLGAPVAVARNDSGLALAVVGLAAVSVAALAVGLHRPDGGPPVAVAETLVGGRTMGQYEAFENARREAARQLAERVEPGDVIQTCYGWFAFEAPEAVIDETCPLNTREPVGPPRWLALTTYPGDAPPVGAPLGLDPVITVRSEVGDGGRADVYELPGPGR